MLAMTVSRKGKPHRRRLLPRLLRLAMRSSVGAITGVETTDPVVALSFDDGPDAVFTPRLLDILERHGARGTFFMVGEAAARQPELVRQIAQAGHAIGNHTWDHPSLPLISRDERLSQIPACAHVLAPHEQRLLRPPYGHLSLAARLDVRRLGYQLVAWDQPAQDWRDIDPTAVLARLLSNIRPGSIVLFHDRLHAFEDPRFADRGTAFGVVDALLARCAGAFQFVTIPELLGHGRPRRGYQSAPPDLAFLNQLMTADGQARRYPAAPPPSRVEAILSRMGV